MKILSESISNNSAKFILQKRYHFCISGDIICHITITFEGIRISVQYQTSVPIIAISTLAPRILSHILIGQYLLLYNGVILKVTLNTKQYRRHKPVYQSSKRGALIKYPEVLWRNQHNGTLLAVQMTKMLTGCKSRPARS